MEYIDCIICSKGKLKYLFSKYSGNSELFKLVKCLNCGLEFISPRPAVKEITKYYELEYFSNRTDRGYDNYFSKKARDEIERVFVLNLGDLDFFEFESNIKGNKAGLDIGCAAGYFVNFLQNRNWESFGIDVSLDCVKFAQKNNLKVEHDDYLKYNFGKKFNLVTLWASIEHLHYPGKFLKKYIKTYWKMECCIFPPVEPGPLVLNHILRKIGDFIISRSTCSFLHTDPLKKYLNKTDSGL